MRFLFNIKKSQEENKRLAGELDTVTKDRDNALTKLQEFEAAHKDYIESAQTAEQMQSEFDAKLAEKDKEIALLKEATVKEVEQVKTESEKTVAEVKETVAAEAIALVASQGTNIVIEPVVKVSPTKEDLRKTLQTLKGKEKQDFYNKHRAFFVN